MSKKAGVKAESNAYKALETGRPYTGPAHLVQLDTGVYLLIAGTMEMTAAALAQENDDYFVELMIAVPRAGAYFVDRVLVVRGAVSYMADQKNAVMEFAQQ